MHLSLVLKTFMIPWNAAFLCPVLYSTKSSRLMCILGPPLLLDRYASSPLTNLVRNGVLVPVHRA